MAFASHVTTFHSVPQTSSLLCFPFIFFSSVTNGGFVHGLRHIISYLHNSIVVICFETDHHENTPIQIQCILKILQTKRRKFSDKIFWYFSYSCSKHRLLVLVRTASARRFERDPQSMYFLQNKKNNVYPCEPQFYYIKVGFKGVKII